LGAARRAIFSLPKNSFLIVFYYNFFLLLSGKGANTKQKYFIKNYLRAVMGEKKMKNPALK
jgi:hypothetical protein